MGDHIYTIPVNELMEPRCGCPMCAMRDMLEERCLEYIMGAAMMEPDVRIETNRKGFCRAHYEMMLHRKNRLSLALMLESHLKELTEQGLKPSENSSGGLFRKKESVPKKESCYVCDKIDWAVETMLDTILKQYTASEEFRQLYQEQEFLCLPHYQMLAAYAEVHMDKKKKKTFLADSLQLCKQSLDLLQADVSHYCKMFDYRNQDGDWGTSKDSIERTIYFLTSRKVEE